MSRPAVEFRDIAMRFGAKVALRDVNLTIETTCPTEGSEMGRFWVRVHKPAGPFSPGDRLMGCFQRRRDHWATALTVNPP